MQDENSHHQERVDNSAEQPADVGSLEAEEAGVDMLGDAGSETDALEPALQRQVDENLQLLYRRKIEETLPDALQDLVARLLSEGASK